MDIAQVFEAKINRDSQEVQTPPPAVEAPAAADEAQPEIADAVFTS